MTRPTASKRVSLSARMWISGWGFCTAACFTSASRSSRLATLLFFQYTLPSRSTATVMFSGLVCVGMLTAFGRATFTVLVITGIVMRKMMSSTSITSTSGVVLIVAMTLGSSPPETGPTLIAIFAFLSLLAQRRCRRCRRAGAAHLITADAGAADEIGMQVAREVPQRILQGLVAPEQPVVAHDRGNRDEQADGRHDQRLADGTGDLVDARLPGDTDRDQRVQDAPHRTEQADERGRRAHGGEQSQSLLQLAVHLIHCALQ